MLRVRMTRQDLFDFPDKNLGDLEEAFAGDGLLATSDGVVLNLGNMLWAWEEEDAAS